MDLILGTPRHQKECKSLSFFDYFAFAKRPYFGALFEDPLKPRKANIASRQGRRAKNEDVHVFKVTLNGKILKILLPAQDV